MAIIKDDGSLESEEGSDVIHESVHKPKLDWKEQFFHDAYQRLRSHRASVPVTSCDDDILERGWKK